MPPSARIVGSVAERVGEGLGLRVGIDEDERAERVDRHGHETERLAVEAGLAVGARRAPERPVERVRPGVVRALDRLAPVVGVAEHVAPVAADVDEAAQLAVAAAGEEDREHAGPRRGQLPGLRDLVEARGVLPRAAEQPLLLEAEDRGVRVPVVRERPRQAGGRHRANLDDRFRRAATRCRGRDAMIDCGSLRNRSERDRASRRLDPRARPRPYRARRSEVSATIVSRRVARVAGRAVAASRTSLSIGAAWRHQPPVHSL